MWFQLKARRSKCEMSLNHDDLDHNKKISVLDQSRDHYTHWFATLAQTSFFKYFLALNKTSGETPLFKVLITMK